MTIHGSSHATRDLDVKGGRIAYDHVGEGPLIVATPAMLDLRSELRYLTPVLAMKVGMWSVSFLALFGFVRKMLSRFPSPDHSLD